MSITLETKKAYAAKTRKSNYAASLRLEGYKMNPADGDRDLPTHEEILKAFTKIERNV
ncbi:YhfG family protein [Pseudomonas baltica]|uniref:YhfG family protein n=1 Tax=Pseudomonas baltica TaxID=2762576 RepID=UPI00289EC71D|nr:YhfG family protein [Pseudomonas baltica]